jgi:hypothetical protein
MEIYRDEKADTVSFIDFKGKDESLLYLLILKYLNDNKISYVQPSNKIVITRFHFEQINEVLLKEIDR